MSMQVAQDRPPVPRRTQSVRVLSGYKSRGLRVTDAADDTPDLYRPARSLSMKKQSRKSLDAMEQQADDLFDFLSDLENKKSSGNPDDILSFLAGSLNVDLDGKDKVSDGSPEKKSGIPPRSKRLSVRDKAKMFLKPDIQEDPQEPTEGTKRYSKSLGTRRIASFSENMNNNHSTEASSLSSTCSICTIPEECDSTCNGNTSARLPSLSSPVFEDPKTSVSSNISTKANQSKSVSSSSAGNPTKRKILFATTVHFTDASSCDHQNSGDKDSRVGSTCLGL